jgi:hypothetical protein
MRGWPRQRGYPAPGGDTFWMLEIYLEISVPGCSQRSRSNHPGSLEAGGSTPEFPCFTTACGDDKQVRARAMQRRLMLNGASHVQDMLPLIGVVPEISQQPFPTEPSGT